MAASRDAPAEPSVDANASSLRGEVNFEPTALHKRIAQEL
jgi:hypothetical protein